MQLSFLWIEWFFFIFIVYKLDTWSRDLNSDVTLKDYLFGGGKLAKNIDVDKYVHSGYGIGYKSHSAFLSPDGSMNKNLIIFGNDKSSSALIDSKNKDILILGKGPSRGSIDNMLTTEAKYLI